MTMDALDRAAIDPENEGKKQQRAIKKARQALIDAGVKDPGARSETASLKHVLTQAITELEVNPFSPEANTNYWRAKIAADGKRIELDIFVPECNWTEEEIRRPMRDKEGNDVPSMMVYVPLELMGRGGLVKLGQMYPEMNDWSVQVGTLINDHTNAYQKGGWIKVEKAIVPPNLHTSREELLRHAKQQGYFGLREATYILAAQASKDRTGHWFDEAGYSSYLLGSYYGGGELKASFESTGKLNIAPIQVAGWMTGGRFEQAKAA